MALGGNRTIVLLGLFLAPLLVFWPVHEFGYVPFDDALHVHQNPHLNPPTLSKVASLWTKPYHGLYVPLTYTAWAVQAKFAGGTNDRLSPELFHVGNLLIHSLNGVLLYLLLSALGLPALSALFGSLLFAWHPLQVEPVAWISALKDLLCGFFVLLALWQYVLFSKAEPGTTRRRRYCFAILAFGLGLLAKPAALVFPLLAGILEIAILRRPWRASLRCWAPWLLTAIPIWIVTKGQQPDALLGYVAPWQWRPLLVGEALSFYLSKLVFPFFLTLNYGRPPEQLLADPWTYVAWIVPVAVVVLLWRRQDRRWWLAGAALFTAYLLPVLGLVPFYYQRFATVADRFVYLALVGPALALAWWLARGGRRRYAVATCVLCLLAFRSHQQLQTWRDSRSMIRQVASVNPRDPEVHYSLGIVLAEDTAPPGSMVFNSEMASSSLSENEERDLLEKERMAAHHFREAIRLNPNHAFAHNNLALLLHRKGKLAEAEVEFRKAIGLAPNLAQAFNNLGVVLAQQGKISQAVEAFSKAVALMPADAKNHINLGMALEAGKESAQARIHFFRALEINADNDFARLRLADNLAGSGKPTEAILHYEALLKRSPDDKNVREKLVALQAQAPKRRGN